MTYVSVGDMARLFQLRQHSVGLQKMATRLAEEATSGQVADVAGRVGGDYTALAGIDSSLDALASHDLAASEAGLFAGSLQSALGMVEDLATDLSPTLLSFATTTAPAHVDAAASDAREKLFATVGLLNTEVAGRHLLSGTATDRSPISGGQEILDALSGVVAGQTTVAGIDASIAAWFDAAPGAGGFSDVIYQGSAAALAPWPVGRSGSATIDVQATEPALRTTLRGLATAALVDQGLLAGDPAARADLTRRAGEILTGAATGLAELRADLGATEASIDTARTRNGAERSAFEIARTELLAADPYETASALSAVTTQIETLYTLTARLSHLSLTEYL